MTALTLGIRAVFDDWVGGGDYLPCGYAQHVIDHSEYGRNPKINFSSGFNVSSCWKEFVVLLDDGISFTDFLRKSTYYNELMWLFACSDRSDLPSSYISSTIISLALSKIDQKLYTIYFPALWLFENKNPQSSVT